MSIETIKVMEPRVAVKPDVEKNHVVLMGGQRVTEQVAPSDSWGSAGQKPVQALWTINPPSTQTIVDRRMRVRCYWEVKTDQDLQLGTNDALRAFPIASLTDVCTVQINGETISDNVADKVHAMLCYGNDAQSRLSEVSMTPSMPDGYQRYSDWALYGSGKNALSQYGETGLDEGRGGFPVDVVDSKTFRAVTTEPLFLSPFLSGFEHQDEGLVNINQINLSIRWKSDLSQILSHSSLGNAITNVTVTMYRAPEVLTTFITPDLTEPIPQLQVLPYSKPQEYIKQVSTLAPGASTKVISDSIKLSQIPRKMYLFCRHARASANQNTADAFLRIDGLSILFNNQSGLFSSASEQDLYAISKSNGLNMSYPQWRRYKGGVFCAEFGKDLGLLDSEAAGCIGQYTIQIQMDVTNVSGDNFTPEFYTIFQNEGTFSISEQFARASLGNLTPAAVLQAKQSEELSHMHYQDIQGAGFFSSLKSVVNKISRGIQSALPLASKVVGAVAPEFAPALAGVGAAASAARQLSGGTRIGGRLAKRLSRR